MATTVAQLEAKFVALSQDFNNLRATEADHWAAYQAGLLKISNEVSAFLRDEPAKQAPRQEQVREEPWRMPLAEFLDYKENVEADWEQGGNAKTGQRLAKALKRTSGHAEGQLYIDWCAKVGRDSVRAFWISRGKSEIPEGL